MNSGSFLNNAGKQWITLMFPFSLLLTS